MTLVTRIVSIAALALVASACAQPFRCGALGEYCCVNDDGSAFCHAGSLVGDPALNLSCDFATVTCQPGGVTPVCGALGQACCGATTCTGVDGSGNPLLCTAGTCQSPPSGCGALGQACCSGACTGALVCNAGTCESPPSACGALGQPCCSGTCTGALVCNAGSCQSGPSGTACPGTTGPCDIGLQDCGPGQACALSIEGTTSCRSAGAGGDQSACSTDTQCAVGHYCSPFSGRCHPQCCGDADCGSSQVCIATAATGDAGLCFGSPCDAVSGGGCASGSACYVAGNPAGGVLTLCVPPGSVAAGGACDTLDACVPGYGCLGSVCTQLCRPSAPSCDVGTCALLEGTTDLGACQ